MRTGAVAVAACVVAHVLLAAATLAAAGELPDWGRYLAYLKEFLFGDVGDITYDFSHWSAGLPVGAAYLASAAAFVLVVRRRRDLVDEERAALIALCGATAYGIALFSYFVNRSADHILPYVSLPALMVGILWLSLLLRGALAESRALRLGGLAFALSVAVLLVSVAWSSIGPRVPRTALAHVVPGGESLGGALDRLWHPAPIEPRAPQGEALLNRYMPGDGRVPIIVTPDLETEILIRSGRANGLGLSYPTEDSFVTAADPAARAAGGGRAATRRSAADADRRARGARCVWSPAVAGPAHRPGRPEAPRPAAGMGFETDRAAVQDQGDPPGRAGIRGRHPDASADDMAYRWNLEE